MVTKRSRRPRNPSGNGAVNSSAGKPSLQEPLDPIEVNQENGKFPSSGGAVQADKIIREVPEISEERKALVAEWQSKIRLDKEHFKKVFEKMRSNMTLNRIGGTKEWVASGKYTVPIINRKINVDVAALYAKNPRCSAKKKKRMMFKLWDGTNQSAQAAYQMAQEGDPTAAAIVQEILQFQQSTTMLNRMGQTMEILFDYYTNIGTPTFKKSMKRLVRRTKTCAVGYVELGYQRILEPDPAITDKIDDVTNQIAQIESSLADVADGEIMEGDPRLEQLRLNLKELQGKEQIIVREGPVFHFPKSTAIIPHKRCFDLSGFQGADYVTEEFLLSDDEIQSLYKVDIKSGSNASSGGVRGTTGFDDSDNSERRIAGEDAGPRKGKKSKGKNTLWRVLDKKNRQVFVIVDGYPDFIKEPAENPVKVNGFWNIFSLTFNDVEDEEEIFPMSDVEFMRDPQKEFNTARQGLREHRKANRPKYFARKGALEKEEKELLEDHPANAVIELKGMDAKTPIDSLITGFKSVAIDPNLYSTTQIMQDVMFGVGSQSADLGQPNTASATQSSISEQSKMSTLGSNVDDLDTLLSELADAMGQLMLAELSIGTVQEIAGPGAVWPHLNRDQISKELILDIKAGSSGKPNKQAELANMERGMPYLIQIGGIQPSVLSNRYGELLDLPMEELEAVGMPSIIALNAIAIAQAKNAEMAGTASGGQVQPGTGNAATNPADQGAAGGNNAAKAPANEPGAQPAYPASVHHYDANGGRI